MSGGASVREAWSTLAAAQKPGHGVPWYMREVNRRLGRGVAAVLSTTRATPDHVTLASALLAAAGLVVLVLAPVGIVTAVVVVLLLQAAFALDAADGQLARLTGRGTAAGEWTDHVVDAARTVCFHLAIAIALVHHGQVATGWALVPLGFCTVASVRFFAQILAEQLRRDDPVGSTAAAAATGGRSAWVQLPADTGVVNAALLLWPWAPAFLLGYGVLALANGLLLLATLVRKRQALLDGAR